MVSHIIDNSQPPPSAKPLTAAMIGLPTLGKYACGWWKSGRESGSNGVNGRASPVPPAALIVDRSFMSAPAQKPRPAPVRTMTRTLLSAAADSIA